MARILCSTGSLIGRPNGRDYRLLEPLSKKLICDGFEFMMYSDWYDKTDDIVSLVKDLGLNIPAYHAQKSIGENISKGGPEEMADAFERFRINADMAVRMGAEKLVIHLWDGITSDQHFDNNIKAYQELSKISKESGISLLVENVVCNVMDPWNRWMQLLDIYPEINFVYDTKMAAFHDQLPLLYMDENDRLWKEGHIKHYHVNDYGGGYKDWANLRTLPIGKGHIDFEEFFEFVKKTGYDDTFTLESTAFDSTGAVDTDMLNSQARYIRKMMGDNEKAGSDAGINEVETKEIKITEISEEAYMSEEAKKNFHKNPIIKNIYTADPAPSVFGDTLYLYTTHDEDELVNNFYTMNDWRCFSTKDMVNWTDHGKIFSLDDIEWADARAWAPQAIERNGKYYLYCPVHKKDGGMSIAVGISDSPTGPFKDLGHPLVDEPDWNDIDPTVFIDDDGQAYLYFGNPELRYVLLNEDMISYDETVGVVKVPMTEEAFNKGSHDTGTSYGEGPWFYKRNGLYYMVYAAFAVGQQNEHLAYSTSEGPTGPWKYGGVLMATGEGDIFTNHPGICEFKGHNYLFYHTGELPGGSLFHRSVCVAEFKYNEDGSIDTIEKCDGVGAV